jgi:cystathionine beta-lyase/cystathionine gamma-synthase
MRKRRWGAATTAVHAGDGLEPGTGSVVTPIYQTSTFAYPERPDGRGGWAPANWFYTRYANPTTAGAEAKVAALEGAERCLAFASGMAAMSAAVLGPVRSGGRVLSMSGIYGGTQSLLAKQVPALGVGVDVSASLDAGVLADLASEDTSVVITELPTNPFNRIVDLPGLVGRLEKRWGRERPWIVSDATFATPLNLRPLEHGADFSVHSATKYLNGHSDLVGGVVSGAARDLEPLESWRRNVGASMDPHQAFLLSRGLKTLELRVRRAEHNARILAEALDGHRQVEEVWHLSLKGHPDHALARRLLEGPGAVVAFRLRRGGLAASRRLLHGLELFAPAPSLGGVESLASLPIETSHASMGPKEQRAQGITPTLVRLAVGIETAEDLVEDVRRALRSL